MCQVRDCYLVKFFFILRLLNAIQISFSTNGNNYAVSRGSSTRLSCIPRNVQVEGESDVGSNYSWLDQDDKEIIDARFTILASGQLEISNAHIADSGVYTCKFRPPTTWNSASEKSFQHKLIVYEVAGHSFLSAAFFDLSTYTAEGTINILLEILKSRVCGNDLCVPEIVKSKKCVFLETGKQTCEFELIYKGIESLPDEQCDEECVAKIEIESLKKAETSLKLALLSELENPRALLKPDMRSFRTKHLIACRAGFRLVKTHLKRCFPCFPGTYSKHNHSLKCHMCAVGFYQDHFAKHQCEKCDEGKTTDSVGAKFKDQCVSTNAGILNNIKEGIKSIFTG